MKTLIFIISETGAGKDTVASMLPYPKVVSYTTRPMRREDVNGIHHHFVTESFYQNNIKDRSDIVSYTQTGNVKYWALEKDLEDVSIYIINPDGVRWFKENYKGPDMKYIVIGLYVPLEERAKRCETRSDFVSSFYKRVADEQHDYDLFRLNGEFDYLIKNYDSKKTANIIKNIVEKEVYSDTDEYCSRKVTLSKGHGLK